MDLLFSKYASPFLLLDGMISTGRFEEFVFEFLKLESEEKEWEFYLHKVFDKTFADFKTSVEMRPQSKENLETTIRNSNSILQNFIPDRG